MSSMGAWMQMYNKEDLQFETQVSVVLVRVSRSRPYAHAKPPRSTLARSTLPQHVQEGDGRV